MAGSTAPVVPKIVQSGSALVSGVAGVMFSDNKYIVRCSSVKTKSLAPNIDSSYKQRGLIVNCYSPRRAWPAIYSCVKYPGNNRRSHTSHVQLPVSVKGVIISAEMYDVPIST
ncbi:hypothetical protein CBL_11148 [Carabus blaptoides fortunei]